MDHIPLAEYGAAPHYKASRSDTFINKQTAPPVIRSEVPRFLLFRQYRFDFSAFRLRFGYFCSKCPLRLHGFCAIIIVWQFCFLQNRYIGYAFRTGEPAFPDASREKEDSTMSQQYEPGMHVRYGGTGICLIDRVEEVPYPGPQPMRLCYVLKPLRNVGMEVSVPLDNETLCAKMQPLRSREEIDSMLDAALQDTEMPWNEERKLRGAEFRKILAGGDAHELLRMIRCILRQSKILRAAGKHLSAMDDNARKDAARMLDEEFAFSLNMTPEEASNYICEKLNQE